MDQAEAIKKAMAFSALIVDRFKPDAVVLYGSYAKGTQKEDSDIDIAVICDRIGEDWLGQTQSLFKLRRSIDPHIEPVLLETGTDRSGFVDEILKTGQVLYRKIRGPRE